MKKFIKIAGMALIPVYIAVFTVFIFPEMDKKAEVIPSKAEILELWHTDLFEGGSGSRADFLRQAAVGFEAESKGIFILVKNLTYEQMIHNLEQGYSPDMFSYGQGLANMLLPEMCAFGGNITLFTNMAESGVIEDRVFGVPWCAGGYIIAGINEYISDTTADYTALLANSFKERKNGTLYSFTAGYSVFNNPMLAAFISNSDIKISEKSVRDAAYTQYEAYSKFVSKTESVFLLGTQRDAVRLSGRDNSADFTMQPLSGFTDLVCYMGIAKKCKGISWCNKFIEYLVSEKTQAKLPFVNMFSTSLSGLYAEGIMSLIEQKISGYHVLNVFTAPEILLDNREKAFSALKGDTDSAKKIWEMLP